MSKLVFKKPEAILENFNMNFCPGCDHGIAVRLIAEVLDELEVGKKTMMAASVGCSVFAYNYFNVDVAESPHGRAPAVATGLKRIHPENIVFTYQGDGDAGAIGLSELIHTAVRGENITVFCINNTNFGMTGGQGGVTTIPGQKTTTTPMGRNVGEDGHSLNLAEMVAMCRGSAFVARGSMDSIPKIKQAKQYVKTALEYQRNKAGFTFVELLAICPTNSQKSPQEAHEWVREELYPIYPLGIFKDINKNKEI